MSENKNKPASSKKLSSSAGEKLVSQPELIQETEPIKTQKTVPLVVKDVDLHQIITVRNGFQGTLVYKDKRTGCSYQWDNFGDEQDMELGELRNARGSAKKFFENNWFLFDEAWVPEYLGMGKYYKYALNVEDFDDIFKKDPDEISEIISELSTGQRKSVAYRARQLISEGGIDSRKVVSTLEECLGVDLVEK